MDIRAFEYRPRRIDTGFAVDFACGARTNQGVCWNMAEAGMRAEFASPVHLGEIGQLTLFSSESVFQIEAKVACVNGRQAGLVFRFQNQEERSAAAELARRCKFPRPVAQAE